MLLVVELLQGCFLFGLLLFMSTPLVVFSKTFTLSAFCNCLRSLRLFDMMGGFHVCEEAESSAECIFSCAALYHLMVALEGHP